MSRVVIRRGDAIPATETEAHIVAILYELSELIKKFLETGTNGIIDLMALPLDSASLHSLRRKLGRGEVTITLAAWGASQIWETAQAGVWWIEHQDEVARLVSRQLVVADVPSIVRADRAEMMLSMQMLASNGT